MSAALVYAVYLLQLKQVEMQETVMVVVPRHFIDAGTLLTRHDLELRPIVRAAYDPRMLVRIEDAVGLESVIPLARNEPVMDWKLDKFRLMPGSGQMTFQIPKHYVLSVSDHIRAGDRVNIYVSGEHGSELLFEESVVVASVRSSSHSEVSDPGGSSLAYAARGDYEQLYVSRRQANGAIESINLNLRPEQWLTIDRICKDGQAQLVIAYVPPQIDHSVKEASRAADQG